MSELRQKCFWLLLAATIAVDCTAVICWWNVSRPVNWDELYPTCVSTALALGQVSVIGIWVAFRGRHDAWSYIVPAIAIGIAAIVRSKLWVFGGFTLTDFACRTALQMLGTLFGLRLIQRTPIWRRLSPGSLSSRWEFSMRQLLIWMTSIAIFFGLVARSTWSDGQ